MAITATPPKTSFLTQLQFRDDKDIATASSDKTIASQVQEAERSYYLINAKQATANLTQVGKLLQLAYAGSKGFKCSVQVIRILGSYQTLIGDTFITSTTFVAASLSALRTHSLAIRLIVEKGAYGHAMEVLSRCSEMAGKMAQASDELVKKSEELCKMSMEALEAAASDETIAHADRARIQAEIAETTARSEKLKVLTQKLADDVEDAKKREQDAIDRTERAENRSFIVGIIGAVMAPIGLLAAASMKAASTVAPAAAAAAGGPAAGVAVKALLEAKEKSSAKEEQEEASLDQAKADLEKEKGALEAEKKKENNEETIKKKEEEVAAKEQKVKLLEASLTATQKALADLSARLDRQAEQYRSTEAEFAKQRAEIQKEQRDANAELAGAVAKLQGLSDHKSEIAKAIASLEVTIKTLGKIKTVFENTRRFWAGVQKQCEALTDIRELKVSAGSEMEDDFLNALHYSGICWLALGEINYQARESMRRVVGSVDAIVNDIPNEKESIALVKELSDSLKEGIEAENLALTQ